MAAESKASINKAELPVTAEVSPWQVLAFVFSVGIGAFIAYAALSSFSPWLSHLLPPVKTRLPHSLAGILKYHPATIYLVLGGVILTGVSTSVGLFLALLQWVKVPSSWTIPGIKLAVHPAIFPMLLLVVIAMRTIQPIEDGFHVGEQIGLAYSWLSKKAVAPLLVHGWLLNVLPAMAFKHFGYWGYKAYLILIEGLTLLGFWVWIRRSPWLKPRQRGWIFAVLCTIMIMMKMDSLARNFIVGWLLALSHYTWQRQSYRLHFLTGIAFALAVPAQLDRGLLLFWWHVFTGLVYTRQRWYDWVAFWYGVMLTMGIALFASPSAWQSVGASIIYWITGGQYLWTKPLWPTDGPFDMSYVWMFGLFIMGALGIALRVRLNLAAHGLKATAQLWPWGFLCAGFILWAKRPDHEHLRYSLPLMIPALALTIGTLQPNWCQGKWGKWTTWLLLGICLRTIVYVYADESPYIRQVLAGHHWSPEYEALQSDSLLAKVEGKPLFLFATEGVYLPLWKTSSPSRISYLSYIREGVDELEVQSTLNLARGEHYVLWQAHKVAEADGVPMQVMHPELTRWFFDHYKPAVSHGQTWLWTRDNFWQPSYKRRHMDTLKASFSQQMQRPYQATKAPFMTINSQQVAPGQYLLLSDDMVIDAKLVATHDPVLQFKAMMPANSHVSDWQQSLLVLYRSNDTDESWQRLSLAFTPHP